MLLPTLPDHVACKFCLFAGPLSDTSCCVEWLVLHHNLGYSMFPVLACRLPGVTPDDLEELAEMMEVTVAQSAGQQESHVIKLVRGSSVALAERLSQLQQLLKQC